MATSVIERGTVPTGTQMLFYNSAAPIGWTKVTSAELEDSAIRIVNGSVGTSYGQTNGGTGTFSSVYSTTGWTHSVTSRTLTSSQIAHHVHEIPLNSGGNVSFADDRSFDWTNDSTAVSAWVNTDTQGGSGSHTHSVNTSADFTIDYVTVIVCSKD